LPWSEGTETWPIISGHFDPRTGKVIKLTPTGTRPRKGVQHIPPPGAKAWRIDQIANAAQVNRTTVIRKMDSGELPSTTLSTDAHGNRLRVAMEEDVMEWLRSRKK